MTAPGKTDWAEYAKRCRGVASTLATIWALCALIGFRMPSYAAGNHAQQLNIYFCNVIGAVGIMAGIAAPIAQQASRCQPPKFLRSGVFWAIALIAFFSFVIVLFFLPSIVASAPYPVETTLFGTRVVPAWSPEPMRSAYAVLAIVLMIFCGAELFLLFVACMHRKDDSELPSHDESKTPSTSGSCLKGCVAIFVLGILLTISFFDFVFIANGGGLALHGARTRTAPIVVNASLQ